MTYFKHSGISDSVARLVGEIETESNPDRRCDLVVELMKVMSHQLSGSLARLCFDMRMSGVSSVAIAIRLGISERAVKRLIRKRAIIVGAKNPLERISIGYCIDIRDLVKT